MEWCITADEKVRLNNLTKRRAILLLYPAAQRPARPGCCAGWAGTVQGNASSEPRV